MFTGKQVHTHLDWKPPAAWLGTQPYLLAERASKCLGGLACPPDPAHTAWVRFFAISADAAPQEVWQWLWPMALEALHDEGVQGAAGVSLDGWMDALYRNAGFEQTHAVVGLSRARGTVTKPDSPAGVRLATLNDWEKIVAVDALAFTPPWQMSAPLTRFALRQASHLTVAEIEGEIVGYQLTTGGEGGAHLARLAVAPTWQGRSIGAALVAEMLDHVERAGAWQVSVNTQDSNVASLAVYRRMGFELTSMHYPVYQAEIGGQKPVISSH